MQSFEPHGDVVGLALAAIGQRHAPILGEDAQHVLEGIHGADRPAAEADHLVPVAQAAAKGVAILENVGHGHAAVGPARDTRAPSVA